MEERKAKIIFNKTGAGNITPRVTLPAKWIKHLGLNINNREVNIKLIDSKIIIENIKEETKLKHYKFETSSTFDNLVKEYGLEGITDLDIGEECDRHNINYIHLETWEYENGYLEIYVEE